jgi:DNA-binding transcriptional ArsR family regulator
MASHVPRPTTITDVAVMRALAHPARLALLEQLGSGGPATATECAEVVSLTPSATSYHLRALAKAGMVEEAPGRGDGRERFWRSTVAGYLVEGGPDEDLEVRAAKAELFDSFVAWEEAKVRRYAARVNDEPKDWQDAAYFADQTLLVTSAELTSLSTAITELLQPYYKRVRESAPPGARTVSALFRAFPLDNPLPEQDLK